ncbi:uncharacterized protein [Coffea arabica]|uniref:Uncharacterized protein n=1 Tax=Coffea arabica TaxID=13443 RepID=A0A6P6TTC6_COFAR|nr:uncharacterized protein LOC113703661 [Coffea arabica]
MGLTGRSYYLIWLFLYLYFSLVYSFNESLGESLDAILHDHAFSTLFHGRSHTGALYNASLPPNLAGMKVSVVRLRSRTLWRLGANFSNFAIPSRTLPVPYVRRLLIVYHDLGNLSTYYYNTSGYTLLTSVVGFLVYDASNLSSTSLRKLDLNPMGKPILIQFQDPESPGGTNPRAECATFGAGGNVFLSKMSSPNLCQSRSQGHFSLVTRFKKRPQVWKFWVIGFVLGFVFLVSVGFILGLVLIVLTVKRTREMEREADEGEFLQTFWVDSSKMPRASITRTHPVLENSGRP